MVRLVTNYIPIVRHYEEQKFFTINRGRRTGTLLLLVLVIVEITDLVFAVDFDPRNLRCHYRYLHRLHIQRLCDPWTSFNVFLAGVVEKFHYLKMGLAIVLTFIGAKMLIVAAGIHIPIEFSLTFVAIVLLSSVAASLLWPKAAETDIQVDLPEGFDSPFADNETEGTINGVTLEKDPLSRLDSAVGDREVETETAESEKDSEPVERL